MNSVFKHHVFICTQDKPDGIPSCSHVGGKGILDLFRQHVGKAGLAKDVLVTGCGCLGLCDRGPNVVIYPEGMWYTSVTPEDVPRIVEEHLRNSKPLTGRNEPDEKTLKEEVGKHRQKVLAMMAAKEKLGVLPDELNMMIRAFMPSRTILSAVELDVFTAIGTGATAADVAQKVSADEYAIERLLNALVSLKLLMKKDDIFYNSDISDTFLREGGLHDSRAALFHSINLWPRWSTLTECIKKGTSVTFEEMKDRGDGWAESFIAAMHKNAVFRAPQVISALDLSEVKNVLDIGGGSGAYSIQFVRAKENITATVFDLPSVTPLTERYIRNASLEDRIKTVTGDLREDDYGSGFDLAFISAICHMLSPEGNIAMFQKAHRALRSGGQIVLQDFILNEDKTGPKTAALFALNMLVGTRKGSAYSTSDYQEWLNAAGFNDIREIRLPGPTGLISARKASS